MKLLKTKAFTLLEMLVGVLLVGTVVIAFLGAFIVSFNNLRRIMELRTATLVLQEKVSTVRELKFQDIALSSGNFSSSDMSSLKGAVGTIEQSFYKSDNKIIKITFKLDWTGFNGEPMQKSLVTLITDHGINKK